MLRVLQRHALSGLRATYASSASGSGTASSSLTNEVRQKIDGVVKSDDVVVFMKGTQQEPMCGFSRNVKLVLDFHNVKFTDYNVLTDPEVREGIKAYSDWPTIPQVFVKGEFVGGCDILVQMHKEGEISDFLDSKQIPNKYGKK
ncbi:unnamed protein product [Caenorhabditis auriculariae]|uniref:Glutaredoxin-related protein 5, mitochondrial n=1 Tax=Caenorhabditis auriculariae TaxID=2777116 RepID=A0A8S1GS20_9PELO|nr:unnamed protein product [Caenorhabditis auriculariae]